ncbi:hypothetical protein QFZ94_004601 [Paraburkholderia sp. JPY465]|uniref:hypothetical protein n=1 Tax=Paraburkholderia sp. JPY465 TaxID=3042285 RepID=UPI003D2005A4
MDTQPAGVDPSVDPSVDAFARSSSSPFADGYDLESERAALAHLIASDDPDPADPFFGRYELFLEREESLDHQQQEHALRQGGDALVRPHEANEINRIGQLTSEGGDRMRLHTRDAMRLFLGARCRSG